MKKQEVDGIEYVLLTPDQYKTMLNSQRYYVLNGNTINIQIPFKDNNVSNWNDINNADSHCGIIYKDTKITLGELRTMLAISINEYSKLNRLTKCKVKFDNQDLNIQELEAIVSRIDSFKTEKYIDKLVFEKETKISI
ncbi:MAG: hypothetical protein IPJ01_10290 [Micavibrio sp.]|nr:hypothetical protein [Micavibrio sp.]